MREMFSKNKGFAKKIKKSAVSIEIVFLALILEKFSEEEERTVNLNRFLFNLPLNVVTQCVIIQKNKLYCY